MVRVWLSQSPYKTQNFRFTIYIDHPKLDHLFSASSNSPSTVGGDFNAHHLNNPMSSSASRSCRAKCYLNHLLQTIPNISLLDKYVSTHLIDGVLDIFVSTALLPLTTWTLPPYFALDHFASAISLDISGDHVSRNVLLNHTGTSEEPTGTSLPAEWRNGQKSMCLLMT